MGDLEMKATGKDINALLLRAQKEVTYKTALLTPERAQSILENHLHQKQRPVIPSQVKRLESDMLRGLFYFPGAFLVFDKHGKLLKGQQNSTSVINSGRSILVTEVSGADEECIRGFDQHSRRSFAQILKMDGKTNIVLQAAITTALYQYQEGNNAANSDGTHTNAKLSQLYSKFEKEIDDTAHFIAGRESLRQLVYPSYSGLLRLLSFQLDPEKSDRFFEALATGQNLKKGNPVYALWKLLTTYRMANNGSRRLRRSAQLHYLFKAWNAFVKGQPLTILKIATNEVCPRVEGR
jgi:hypothetical protein